MKSDVSYLSALTHAPHRQDRLRVDHLLRRGVLDLHDVGEVAGAQSRLVLLERVAVGGLVHELDLDLRLLRLVLGDQALEGLLVRTRHGVPERDLDGRRRRRLVQRADRALRRRRAATTAVPRATARRRCPPHAPSVTTSAVSDDGHDPELRHVDLSGLHHGTHPFTAPAVRPRTSCFWKNRSRITSGSAAITTPANVTFTWSMLVAAQLLQTDLDGAVAIVLGHQEWPQVLVPCAEEGEHAQRRHRRAGERHRDPGHEAPVAVAVERGRVLQVLRDLQERLAQQERTEAGREERHDQARVACCTNPRSVTRRQVGDDRDLERHHQRRQEDDEQRALQRELEERERVAGERRGDDLTDRDERWS